MKRVIKNILGLMVVCVFAACSKSSDEEILPPPVYEYEENPTTLEGTWHLAKALYGLAGVVEYPEADVEVYFTENTMEVKQHSHNADPKGTQPFLDSGKYTYSIVEAEEPGRNNRLLISGSELVPYYYFNKDMLVIDHGMAYDAPGYYFKKVRTIFFY